MVNKKFFVIVLSLLAFTLLFGCLEDVAKSVRDGLNENDKLITPEKIREIPVLTYDANKIVYYFCDQNGFAYCMAGFNRFSSFSREFLHCQVKTIDEQPVADTIVGLKNSPEGVSVKIFFDRDSTYSETGYPREDSMYGYLLRNLVDVQNGVVDETFCVSDRGVLISTGFEPSQNKSKTNSSFYILYNTELGKVLNEKFFEKFKT